MHNLVRLYKIRNWVRGLAPLYISICAALLIELKSNIKIDYNSILYFGGLFFSIIACVISNNLSNRCNDYGRIYDIEYSQYKDSAIERELIYRKGEKRFSYWERIFQYYGVFSFGIIGLVFIILSYSSFTNQSNSIDVEIKSLQNQINTLKIKDIDRKEVDLKLYKINDSVKKTPVE